MEGQKFLLVQDSIRNYQEATAIALMTLNESLQTLQQKIQAFTDLESFQGKTATAAKTYFSEIYTNLLAGMYDKLYE